MQTVRALVEIVRLDSALLGWLSIFVPLFSRTGDLGHSAGQAVPVFLICISTFIANDLDDVSRDAINHPTRPLPSGRVSPELATVVFFGSLVAALFSTKHLIDVRLSFWYYGLTVASVTYGYVVDSLPPLKVLYVAACAAVPVVIVSRVFPDEGDLLIVALALFLATAGREACMDIRDRLGDNPSVMHRLNAHRVAAVALAAQFLALIMLATICSTPLQVGALAAMAATLGAAAWCWCRGRRRTAIALMKTQIALGLAFLV